MEALVRLIVWTDHQNLTYIQSAKRLNFHQARWSLFFGRFSFVLTYKPGSKNGKADALSRQFAPTEESPVTESIIPSSCVVAMVTWEIESVVTKPFVWP